MRANLTLSAATLYAFLLVLARIGGAIVFVPLPGARTAADAPKAALAIGFTLALFAKWPFVPADVTIGTLAVWIAAEAAFGIAIGLTLAIVLETFTLAAQVLGLQAGYAYASTVDPNSEADSGVLLVFAQLMAGMLFFAAGLDLHVLRLFAQSLDRVPPGAYALGTGIAAAIIHLGSAMFSIGLRLALPVVALLIMVDVSLALLGRLNAQLQLLSLAFPAKMLTALVVLSWSAALYPRLLGEASSQAFTTLRRAFGI